MDDAILGKDLKIVKYEFGKDLAAGQGEYRDYRISDGADNLGQAITMRLLTPLGDHAHLGHPSYGSRLFELVGELNNEVNRKLADLYVRKSLAEEGRIESVQDVRVTMNEYQREIIDIHISVMVKRETSPLNFVVLFSMNGVF